LKPTGKDSHALDNQDDARTLGGVVAAATLGVAGDDMSEWAVPLRRTQHGIAIVDAENAQQALEKVAAGDYDDELFAVAETVDWKILGKPKQWT